MLRHDVKGSALCAEEELRAELSSAFLADELNIPSDLRNHASYIEHWLAFLKEDMREMFRAAADAQKIVETILGLHPDWQALPHERASCRAVPPASIPAASSSPHPS